MGESVDPDIAAMDVAASLKRELDVDGEEEAGEGDVLLGPDGD